VEEMKKIGPTEGMLYYLIKSIRPELAERIKKKNMIETIVIGLGRQGTRHAQLMQEYGTTIVAGVAPGKGGTKLLETIPVYNTVEECLREHPDVAVASIWRHYSTAKDATIEAIRAGIPIVVLITEGIPVKDVRDILAEARKNRVMLIGGNTPGIIFPPEGIKIGMLPDIFYPEEVSPGVFGPRGVTIISRSGAILYHMSDALASAGIAQNAVIGIGGDGIVGTTFADIVPVVMGYENTDLVVIAGEIGGCQEEKLAEDIRQHPEKYPKPIVAILSGANAPQGKTMGHAGAIVMPGQPYGTFESKKNALENAGVTVVNSQYDLIEAVREKLGGRKYFEIERYYEKMRKIWEAPPRKPSWGTLITKVEPNNLIIRGYQLKDIIEHKNFLETAYLLVEGDFPDDKTFGEINKLALEAASLPVPEVETVRGEEISKMLSKYLLNDGILAKFVQDQNHRPVEKTIFCLGRIARYISKILDTESVLKEIDENESFSNIIYRVMTGSKNIDGNHVKLIEAMVVASVDHGVTPPSAQATIIAASTRASYEVSVSNGINVITDVHGGAGAKAAEFFKKCVEKAKKENIDLRTAAKEIIREHIKEGRRIEGMGHRIHTRDPRRDILWRIAEEAEVAKDCVKLSKMMSEIFSEVRGMKLPINVDGVIGGIVADMGLDPRVAKTLFIYGRAAGLSAHYFEEVTTQPPMRRINFNEAVYKGETGKKIT
jgi:succinyl-CoA synthetase alpha subunit